MPLLVSIDDPIVALAQRITQRLKAPKAVPMPGRVSPAGVPAHQPGSPISGANRFTVVSVSCLPWHKAVLLRIQHQKLGMATIVQSAVQQPLLSLASLHSFVRTPATGLAAPGSGANLSREAALLAEAAAVAAPRLLINQLEVGHLQLLCEVHISNGIGSLPFGVNMHRYVHLLVE